MVDDDLRNILVLMTSPHSLLPVLLLVLATARETRQRGGGLAGDVGRRLDEGVLLGLQGLGLRLHHKVLLNYLTGLHGS